MRKADCGDLGDVLGLVIGEPTQLGDGQRCDGNGTRGLGPPCGALGTGIIAVIGATFANKVARSTSRTRVIPQQGRTDDVAFLIQADHAVLLTTDGQGSHIVETAGTFKGLLEGIPPFFGINFGAIRVRGLALANDGGRSGVVDDDLARLGRRIYTGNVGAKSAHIAPKVRAYRSGTDATFPR